MKKLPVQPTGPCISIEEFRSRHRRKRLIEAGQMTWIHPSAPTLEEDRRGWKTRAPHAKRRRLAPAPPETKLHQANADFTFPPAPSVAAVRGVDVEREETSLPSVRCIVWGTEPRHGRTKQGDTMMGMSTLHGHSVCPR
ncbi:unnamed protein product [Pleuronectes platessa]|uniref:Uncharacterized protein n=1 Tax=Pleuronectes platessa TaxID=8262 RepID=A0A9N7YBJ4_PLEPL|nr:unnamed protein product [Pleuronectes platessa]